MIFLKGPFIYFHKKWPTFWLPSPPHPTILKNEQQNPQTRDKFQEPPSHFRGDVINVWFLSKKSVYINFIIYVKFLFFLSNNPV